MDSFTNFENDHDAISDPAEDAFVSALDASNDGLGITKTAEIILENSDLKDKITELIFASTNAKLKKSLKHSVLTANKKNRQYLLSLTPRILCEELRDLAPQAYQVLVKGLLGVSDPNIVLENHHLTNVLAMLFSTIAKSVNRKASGYGLLLTAVARDGGMREDSIKLLCNLCHPRTAQKYDKEVLSKGWNDNLQDVLEMESLRFHELRRAELELDQLSEATVSQTDAAADKVELLKNTLPPQVQCVWDNLNLRTKHRYARQRDSYSEFNFDWMASLFVQERISANHMEHISGSALREPDSLSIQDFVPTQQEEDYIFDGLVHYYANRLTVRHPLVFKSLKMSMKARLDLYYSVSEMHKGSNIENILALYLQHLFFLS